MAALLVAYVFMRQSRIRTALEESNTTKTKTETSQLSETIKTSSTMNTTLFSNHELSIPAFLMMNWGLDFRQEKYITKGGGGALFMCTALNRDLAETSKRQPLAIKVISEKTIEQIPEQNTLKRCSYTCARRHLVAQTSKL